MEKEIWKPVAIKNEFIDWGDYYEVSSFGRVRSKATKKLRKICVNDEGYNWITLTHKEKDKRFIKWVHIANLVGLTFIDNPLGLPIIDHINRDKNDCRVENLRWVDGSDSLMNRGQYKKALPKPVAQYSMEGDLIATYSSASSASKETGVNSASILKCCKKEKYRKSAGGFRWEFLRK